MKRFAIILAVIMLPVLASAQKATVIFYSMHHCFNSVGIWIDGVKAADIGNYRTRATAFLTPGEHEFRSGDKANSVLITLEADKTYYIREDYNMAGPGLKAQWVNPQELTRVSETIGVEENRKTKPVPAIYLLAPELFSE